MIVESVRVLKKVKAEMVHNAGGVPMMIPALNAALQIHTSDLAYRLVIAEDFKIYNLYSNYCYINFWKKILLGFAFVLLLF